MTSNASQPPLPPNINVDFISGRGGNAEEKRGNQLLLEDVESNAETYGNCPKRSKSTMENDELDKTAVAMIVINALKARGGRFLENGIDITDSQRCMNKVQQKLREAALRRQRENGSFPAANFDVLPNPDELPNMAMFPVPVEPQELPMNEGARDEDSENLENLSIGSFEIPQVGQVGDDDMSTGVPIEFGTFLSSLDQDTLFDAEFFICSGQESLVSCEENQAADGDQRKDSHGDVQRGVGHKDDVERVYDYEPSYEFIFDQELESACILYDDLESRSGMSF